MVQDTRPQLSWTPVAGAAGYTVTVVDDEADSEYARSPSITATRWRPGSDLVRGRTYRWFITAKMSDGREEQSPRPPAPVARFGVLSREAAAELNKRTQECSGSHLLLGMVYARAGVLDKAERELKLLVHDNPTSALPKALLRSVRRSSGKT